jgi:hypothetical protein
MVYDPRSKSPLANIRIRNKWFRNLLGIGEDLCFVQLNCTGCDWTGTVIPATKDESALPQEDDDTVFHNNRPPPDKCPKCGGKIKKTKIPVVR